MTHLSSTASPARSSLRRSHALHAVRVLRPLAACAALVLGLLPGAVPLAHAANAAPLKIGMTFQELNNPYFVTMQKALNDAAATIGAQVVVTDAHHDVSKQVSDVEDMLQKKIDILLVNPTDSTGIQSAVTSAKKAGVVVVAVDANANGPVDSFVGSRNFDAGAMSCEYLAKAIGGSGEVAILDGIPVVPILERVRGCKSALAKFPNVKVVDTQNGKQERATALSVTENMIQAHPNLKGIFSVNDGGSMGALSAIESSGKDIKLTSVDGAPEAITAIQKPNSKFIETSAQFPRDQIRIAIGIALAKKWGANVPKTIPVDVKLVDKDNAKGFSW
ncbi:ABC transporter substrate-binding protein [Paraburkholderia kururiensis]|uniref:ABC transporter substrate-binding protein n=1 Tax=Paraburkholderia kururiensis TaxID=984307 RepID=A0ABZ0WH96_9BURK|nr:ABC transporter substrate-binding protein [Paraburkholderia kururiensis]WQD76717.1 ABC transporter substrate-binding protein [Paraburkholderia kururiensis]